MTSTADLPPVCFLDTETTSLRPDREVWDIGIIRRNPGGVETVLNCIVGNVDLGDADPMSLKVGHFYERHPHFGGDPGDGEVLDEADAAAVVEELLRGAHLVGAVPNFDAEVLSRLLRRHGLPWSAHHHLIDVETLLIGWLCATDPSAAELSLPWSTDDLSRRVGVQPPGPARRHTAYGDAQWCRDLYDQVLGYLQAHHIAPSPVPR